LNKVIDKGFRSCRFVSTIVKHPVHLALRFEALVSSNLEASGTSLQPVVRF